MSSVKDSAINQVLQTRADSEKLIHLTRDRFWFGPFNCHSAEILPGGGTHGLLYTLLGLCDPRLNQLERYLRDIINDNLDDFIQGKFNSKSVILRGKKGGELTIVPVTVSTPQVQRR